MVNESMHLARYAYKKYTRASIIIISVVRLAYLNAYIWKGEKKLVKLNTFGLLSSNSDLGNSMISITRDSDLSASSFRKDFCFQLFQ